MAAAEQMVFDLDNPRRPSADDVDATLENDVDNGGGPLGPNEPYQNQLNQWGGLCAAYGRVVPVAKIEVRFAAGVPYVFAVQALRSTVVVGDISVTDNGDGDTTLEWPENTFPLPASSPTAAIVDPSHGSWLHPTVETVTNGVRVKTKNSAGTLTDVGFKVEID